MSHGQCQDLIEMFLNRSVGRAGGSGLRAGPQLARHRLPGLPQLGRQLGGELVLPTIVKSLPQIHPLAVNFL